MAKLELGMVLLVLGLTGCASGDEGAVIAAGGRPLKCARSEIQTKLNRETAVVREYLVGCDFMYTRVHCTEKGCHPAEVKPPCIGKGPCFEENPVTLEWELEKTASLPR